MKFKLSQPYTIRAQDVDIRGKWMPSQIFVSMQEIAEDHATLVGKGRDELVSKQGIVWVLTRVNFKMIQYPTIGDTVTVTTWPLLPTRLLFKRQFGFYDNTGSMIGCASTQWVLFDIKDRSIRRTNTIGAYPVDQSLGSVLEEPGKIHMPDTMNKVATRKVLYSEVDMNEHMNNTKYLNWICELFSEEIIREKSPRHVRINYVSEACFGQDVDLYKTKDTGEYYICGKIDNKTVFDAKVGF